MPREQRPVRSVRVLLTEAADTERGAALALPLGREPGIRVVARVGPGEPLADAALAHRPDITLLDLGRLGDAAVLREQVPDCRVVVLATSGRPDQLRRALDAGAAGFLIKDGPVAELAEALHRVLTGETVVDPALTAYLRRSTGGGPASDTSAR